MQTFICALRDSCTLVIWKGRFALALIAIFFVVYRWQVFSQLMLDQLALWLAALVFLIGLPLSALLRVDILETSWAINAPDLAIIIGTSIAVLNCIIITVIGRSFGLIGRQLDKALPKPSPTKEKADNDEDWSL